MNKNIAPEGMFYLGPTGTPTQTVYLGINDKIENYKLITKDEAEAILKSLNEDNNEDNKVEENE